MLTISKAKESPVGIQIANTGTNLLYPCNTMLTILLMQ